MLHTVCSAVNIILLGGLLSVATNAVAFGPECLQNGGASECVPFERINELVHHGDGDDPYVDALVRDQDTNKLIYFKTASEVKAKVDAGYNYTFGACRSWKEISGWKSVFQTCQTQNPHSACLGGGAEAVLIAEGKEDELQYAPRCEVEPTTVRLTTIRTQTASCPAGYVANTPVSGPSAYCTRPFVPQVQTEKNNGCSQNLVGNPCNAATGNKYQREVDYAAPNAGALEFVRSYNSTLGKWTHSYSEHITVETGGSADSGSLATMHRADGRAFVFREGPSRTFVGDPDLHVTLVPSYIADKFSGWTYLREDGTTETYDAQGRLTGISYLKGTAHSVSYGIGVVRVGDSFGRTLEIHKNAAGQLLKLVDPAKRTYFYAYDDFGNLASIQYPNLKKRFYHFNEQVQTGGLPFPNALTGITGENGKRFATFRYDSEQRVVLSEHAAGIDRVTLNYLGGSTEVTDALGTTRTYDFQLVAGAWRNAGISLPCDTCGDDAREKYHDEKGNLKRRVDHKRNVTTYEYDARDLEIGRTVAEGSPEQKTITTKWHERFRKPVEIADGNRVTTLNYDSVQGLVLSRTVTDVGDNSSMTWSYKYNAHGQVREIDGPRTDVNDVETFEYDASGNLLVAKNALGHSTQFTAYDADGRALEIRDPNGLITTLNYDARGRLEKRTVGQEITTYRYDEAGLLWTVTMPSGQIVTYTYDDAYRLTDIKNSSGERIHYTLDPAGNRLKKEVFDATGGLSFVAKSEFDYLGRLQRIIQSGNNETVFERDPNGNVEVVTDPLARQTYFRLDALDRTREVVFNDQSTVKADYDDNDQVAAVLDAKNMPVRYGKNALGQTRTIETDDIDPYILEQTFDSAGNVKSRSSSHGIATYTYDALNRLTSISAPGVTTVVYSYDAGINGKGRLTRIVDESGTTARSYNAQGRIDTVRRTYGSLTFTTRHVYDTAGRLYQLVYPSGRILTYRYDKEKVVGIEVGATTLLSQIGYEPFGAARSWAWGNGRQYLRTADLDGRVTTYPEGAVQRTIERDNSGNITSIINTANSAQSQRFAYDDVNRLTDYFVGSSETPQEHYDYDVNGNRVAIEIAGNSYPYTYDFDSNVLVSVAGPVSREWVWDEVGVQDGTRTFGIDSLRRLSSVRVGTVSTTYLRNGLTQRVTKKSSNGTVAHYVYDEDGHLLAELDKAGATVTEHVWLGDQPVAVLNRGVINYVYADHLHTPRVVTDTSNRVRWSWTSDPFGRALPKDNPSGLGKFAYNLRFPGQYYDAESGLHYNYFRDYDPQTGRYVQSGPIGLSGGVNTYVYGLNSPIMYVDPSGRFVPLVIQRVCAAGGCELLGAIAMSLAIKWALIDSKETGPIRNESAEVCPASGTNSGGGKAGDKDPSTPTGQSGSPMDVPKGTNEPANIGGRDYTGHALDQSQGRGVTPTVVEDTITNGTSRPDRKYPDRTEHTSQDGRVVVITDKESGRVITVISK